MMTRQEMWLRTRAPDLPSASPCSQHVARLLGCQTSGKVCGERSRETCETWGCMAPSAWCDDEKKQGGVVIWKCEARQPFKQPADEEVTTMLPLPMLACVVQWVEAVSSTVRASF